MYLFPVLINLLMLTSFMINIKTDSIMFLLSKGKDEEAKILIDKVYHPDENR